MLRTQTIHFSSAVLIVSLFFLANCRSDPKAKDDSLLASINGAAYEPQQNPLAWAPERKQVRIVRGRVTCRPGLSQGLINRAKVELLIDGQSTHTTYTDEAGNYSFATEIFKGRTYKLKISNAKWRQVFDLEEDDFSLKNESSRTRFVNCTRSPP